MKNILKVLGIIALVAVIGFGVAACSSGGGDDKPTNNPTPPAGSGGGDGNVTFNVTNNYTSKAVSVTIMSNANADPDTIKEISIAGNGGTGSFKVNLTKIITGDYMGQLVFTFEDSTTGMPDGTGYSFDGSGSTFNVTIKANGQHDTARN
jgi:hypothetical protein